MHADVVCLGALSEAWCSATTFLGAHLGRTHVEQLRVAPQFACLQVNQLAGTTASAADVWQPEKLGLRKKHVVCCACAISSATFLAARSSSARVLAWQD